ncbi:amino acid permease [Candidatus Endomicrobiellum cubanum]|uniref:amino acid permease n=1 Tax=Candidatus Endomicrobiellum cubanum TaxID=3242325 RepID=UPI003593F5DC
MLWGEIAVEEPISGSFSVYAHKFISPCVGFVVGWSYWFLWSLSCMVQIGIYCNFWWPFLPQWIPAFLTLGFITCINLLNVKLFGKLGFWLALVKVFALVSIIVAGIVILFSRISGNDLFRFSNLCLLL